MLPEGQSLTGHGGQQQSTGESEAKDAMRGFMSAASPPPIGAPPMMSSGETNFRQKQPPRPQSTGFSPPPGVTIMGGVSPKAADTATSPKAAEISTPTTAANKSANNSNGNGNANGYDNDSKNASSAQSPHTPIAGQSQQQSPQPQSQSQFKAIDQNPPEKSNIAPNTLSAAKGPAATPGPGPGPAVAKPLPSSTPKGAVPTSAAVPAVKKPVVPVPKRSPPHRGSSFDTFLIIINVFLSLAIICTVVGMILAAHALQHPQDTVMVGYRDSFFSIFGKLSTILDGQFDKVGVNPSMNQKIETNELLTDVDLGVVTKMDIGDIGNTIGASAGRLLTQMDFSAVSEQFASVYQRAVKVVESSTLMDQFTLMFDDFVLTIKAAFS